MKIFSNFFLLLFVTFLSTPTIVSVIEKNCDTSIFYTMSEEEETHKNFKVIFCDHHYDINEIPIISSNPIVFENQLSHDSVSPAIFIPPPDLV